MAFARAGRTNAARIAMIAITTSSSMSVNAVFFAAASGGVENRIRISFDRVERFLGIVRARMNPVKCAFVRTGCSGARELSAAIERRFDYEVEDESMEGSRFGMREEPIDDPPRKLRRRVATVEVRVAASTTLQ